MASTKKAVMAIATPRMVFQISGDFRVISEDGPL